jgi:hypothetical protein
MLRFRRSRPLSRQETPDVKVKPQGLAQPSLDPWTPSLKTVIKTLTVVRVVQAALLPWLSVRFYLDVLNVRIAMKFSTTGNRCIFISLDTAFRRGNIRRRSPYAAGFMWFCTRFRPTRLAF